MEFDELISDFAKRHNVADLVAEEGVVALNIDGIIVTVVSKGDGLTISADIGEPPSEGRADFAELLLEANLQSNVFFAMMAETRVYVIVRRLALHQLDAGTFDTALEALVNQAETWRRLLADFRPAAQAAAESPQTEVPSFGSTGFMQV
jgi:hypothetical protein